jgi:hypothetical protein
MIFWILDLSSSKESNRRKRTSKRFPRDAWKTHLSFSLTIFGRCHTLASTPNVENGENSIELKLETTPVLLLS